MSKIRVFVGWDAREPIAYDVCKHSILHRSKIPVEVIPIKQADMRKQGLYRRSSYLNVTTGHMCDSIDNRPYSTEFTYTRFLVPALCGYEGWAVFMDCDMIAMKDFAPLLDLCDDQYAVRVVKHNHKPVEGMKMDGQVQTQYPCKNWSSFILFNCGHPDAKRLKPEMVSFATGAWLHRFHWTSPNCIGHLDHEWNWIEGSSPANIKPAVIHYTEGGPWFDNCQEVAYSEEWWAAYDRYQSANPETVTVAPRRRKC